MVLSLSDFIYLSYKFMNIAKPQQTHFFLKISAAISYVSEADEISKQNAMFDIDRNKSLAEMHMLSKDFHFFELDGLFVIPKSAQTIDKINDYVIPGSKKFMNALINENSLSILGVSENEELNAKNNKNIILPEQKAQLIQKLTEVLIEDNIKISNTQNSLTDAKNNAKFTNGTLNILAEIPNQSKQTPNASQKI